MKAMLATRIASKSKGNFRLFHQSFKDFLIAPNSLFKLADGGHFAPQCALPFLRLNSRLGYARPQIGLNRSG